MIFRFQFILINFLICACSAHSAEEAFPFNVIQIEKLDISAVYYSPSHHAIIHNDEKKSVLRILFFGRGYENIFNGPGYPIAAIITKNNSVVSKPKGFMIVSSIDASYEIDAFALTGYGNKNFEITFKDQACTECERISLFIIEAKDSYILSPTR